MKGASSKDGEAGKAGAAKKSKKTKAAKVKSKKAKANSAAKTDGAGTAPQPGSGESSTTAVLSNLPSVSLGDKVSEIRRSLLGHQLSLYYQLWRLLPGQVSNQSSYVLLWKLPLVAGFAMPLTVIGLSQVTLGYL